MDKKTLLKSKTGRDFLRLKKPTDPNIDEMLDWRNRLNDIKNSKKYPDSWLDNEIASVDEIIKFLNGVN
ncbi:hypothetical protein [Polaribacter aestuariivivens]|uniref:hypothetical protein n=1 Tax=Polaribacter aestuariivivens TaxID=2304626 RepID=UPI003F4945BA